MYGDKFVSEYYAMQEGDARQFDRAVRKYGIIWTALPRKSKLARELDASADWRRIYADKVGVIHLRQGLRPKVN
jgi:hypothetical protein